MAGLLLAEDSESAAPTLTRCCRLRMGGALGGGDVDVLSGKLLTGGQRRWWFLKLIFDLNQH